MNIFIGLIMIAAGFGMVLKTEWLIQNFGRINWAEAHLGYEGGTRLFYKLLGVLIIFAGFSAITGLHRGILTKLVLPLFGVRSNNPF